MIVIGWIRHGSTDWNLERRAQGHRNIPLNTLGIKQAKALALRLKNEHWDRIISSDLSRAWDTAKLIAAYCKLPIHEPEPRLREMDLGLIEGTTEEERKQRWGNDWMKKDLQIETLQAIRHRGIKFMEECCLMYPGQRILLVSHGALILQTFKEIFSDMRLEGPENTSISTIRRHDRVWSCDRYNSTEHLHQEHHRIGE